MATKKERKTLLMAEDEIREQTPDLNRIEQTLSMIDAGRINKEGLSAIEIKAREIELEKRKRQGLRTSLSFVQPAALPDVSEAYFPNRFTQFFRR